MAEKKTVRTAADVARAWKTAEADIARERKNCEKKGETFIGLTKEEFDQKMKRANSPIFTWAHWNNTAPPTGTITWTVGVQNPDPVGWSNLVVSVSIGNRNPIVSNDEFLTTFDARFPTYAKPATIGFSLAPGASTSYAFALRMPAGIEKTGYFATQYCSSCRLTMSGRISTARPAFSRWFDPHRPPPQRCTAFPAAAGTRRSRRRARRSASSTSAGGFSFLVQIMFLEEFRPEILRRRVPVRPALGREVEQVPIGPDRVDMIAHRLGPPEGGISCRRAS